jgi:hypothetical protein
LVARVDDDAVPKNGSFLTALVGVIENPRVVVLMRIVRLTLHRNIEFIRVAQMIKRDFRGDCASNRCEMALFQSLVQRSTPAQLTARGNDDNDWHNGEFEVRMITINSKRRQKMLMMLLDLVLFASSVADCVV